MYEFILRADLTGPKQYKHRTQSHDTAPPSGHKHFYIRRSTPTQARLKEGRSLKVEPTPEIYRLQEATGKATASCEQTAVLNVCTAAASALRS